MATDPEAFFESVIKAGAIIAGFCGTFLAFRIQREANFYHSPGNQPENEQHFTSSFLLIILATILSLVSGFLTPLLYISGRRWSFLTPDVVVAGLVAALVLLAGYFADELVHYRLIAPLRTGWAEWRREALVWVTSLAIAVLLAVLLLVK